jgi:hypothetical protein
METSRSRVKEVIETIESKGASAMQPLQSPCEEDKKSFEEFSTPGSTWKSTQQISSTLLKIVEVG